ncbi:MAG: lysophospholipid acyltransferase family protein [Candidatus Obscuribacterales bacterium]
MLDFRPPLDSPPLIALVNLTLPLYMKFGLCDTKVQLAPGALERFKSYKGKRALICPNHSNRHDPQVMFEFSRLAGETFNYVAAREVFDWQNGFNGWWLQHLGCYSVVRGAADRESFKMTKKILTEGKNKLVLFPEGEISRQNDTLMPLESGAAQLTFWAVEELAKHAAGAALEPVYLMPIAIKYTYPKNIENGLKITLSALGPISNQDSQWRIGVPEAACDFREIASHPRKRIRNETPDWCRFEREGIGAETIDFDKRRSSIANRITNKSSPTGNGAHTPQSRR